MKWKKLAVTALVCMSVSAPVWAAGNPSDEVTPSDWSYKALMMLEKHGAITDMKGIQLGTQSYTRSQLTPLVAYVVDKRESMNESDRMLAIRLYSEYRDELMAYERDQEIARERAQGKTVGLTSKDIQARMADFHIDRSAVNVNGDVRVRFQDGAGKGGRTDYRTRVEMVFGGNGSTSAADAPVELVDEQGKAQLAQADAELEKARKESIQRQAAEQVAALKAQEQAKKDKAQNQKQLDKEAAQLKKADAKAAKEKAAADAKAAKQQAEAAAKAAKAQKEADAKAAKEAAAAAKQAGAQAESGNAVVPTQETKVQEPAAQAEPSAKAEPAAQTEPQVTTTTSEVTK